MDLNPRPAPLPTRSEARPHTRVLTTAEDSWTTGEPD